MLALCACICGDLILNIFEINTYFVWLRGKWSTSSQFDLNFKHSKQRRLGFQAAYVG